MLGAACSPRFSKTARSHPAHREAGWDRQRGRVKAIFNRCFVDDSMEGPAEGAEACKPDVEADVGDASVGFAQQEHRALDATALKVAMRRLAKCGAEGADEMCLRDVGEGSECGDV